MLFVLFLLHVYRQRFFKFSLGGLLIPLTPRCMHIKIHLFDDLLPYQSEPLSAWPPFSPPSVWWRSTYAAKRPRRSTSPLRCTWRTAWTSRRHLRWPLAPNLQGESDQSREMWFWSNRATLEKVRSSLMLNFFFKLYIKTVKYVQYSRSFLLLITRKNAYFIRNAPSQDFYTFDRSGELAITFQMNKQSLVLILTISR